MNALAVQLSTNKLQDNALTGALRNPCQTDER
jgi:hypothetical protein